MQTTTKYAVRREWPDGHVEHDERDGRYSAELTVNNAEAVPDTTLASRTVADTGWLTYVPGMFAKDTTAMAGAEVRWGVLLAWPDGHTEVRDRSRFTGRRYQRRDAEHVVCQQNDPDQPWDGYPQVSAHLVYRLVLAGGWVQQAIIVPDCFVGAG